MGVIGEVPQLVAYTSRACSRHRHAWMIAPILLGFALHGEATAGVWKIYRFLLQTMAIVSWRLLREYARGQWGVGFVLNGEGG